MTILKFRILIHFIETQLTDPISEVVIHLIMKSTDREEEDKRAEELKR